MSSVLVVGAGPAGLTAAYEASKLGLEVRVLEADAQVGGLSRTVNHRGYRFDIGGHRFFSKSPLVNQLWDEILGPEFLLRPRLSRIYYRDRFYDYPLRARNALSQLGPIEAARVVASYARARLAPDRGDDNFEQWITRRFGRRLYEIFFETYTEKVWGLRGHEIAADWASQRIKDLSLAAAIRDVWRRRSGGAHGGITSLIEEFHYPRLGPGMMWERCAELLEERGADLVSGIQVDEIRHRNGRVESVRGRAASGEAVQFAADHVVSSMPLRDLIAALSPAPPDAVLRAARALRYRDHATVVLILKREDVFPDNWIYVHSPEVRVARIQNYKNWSPEMVPDPTRTSLGLEYYLWNSDREGNESPDWWMDLAQRECARIGLIEPGEAQDGAFLRMPDAYPVYDRHFREHLAVLESYLASFDNLQTIGRNGQHRYNNQDHSMLTGVLAARNLAGERNDVWSVNVDPEYHEESGTDPDDGRRVRDRSDPLLPRRLEPR